MLITDRDLQYVILAMNWGSVVPVVRESFLRFPLSFICTLFSALFALLLVHDIEIIDDEYVGKFFASMIYGVIAFTSLKLLIESKNWSVVKHAVGAIIIMAVIVSYVWLVFDKSTSSTYIFFLLALLLTL